MSRLGFQSNRIIRSEQVLTAFTQILRRYLPLDLQETRITEEDILAVLSYASVHQTSIETACQELAAAPSGNRLREVLAAALPPRPVLQRHLNTVLRAQLPKPLRKAKRAFALALDITLIPYHGQPAHDEAEVLKAQAKAGTRHFHGYATISIVHHRHRYVLALRFLQPHESMVSIVRDLLNRVQRLNIPVRRVYLDKEFYSLDVFRTLDRRHLSYVIPIPMRGKQGGIRQFFRKKHSRYETYTLHSTKQHRTYTIRAAIVHRYRSHHSRRRFGWFAFAVRGLPVRMAPCQVFQVYRQRFGIETSYRQMHTVRARNSSRDPRLRLLLVGLALILVNLYVTWREPLGALFQKHSRRRRVWFSLRRLAALLAREFEDQFGVADTTRTRLDFIFS
jgi:putative transposase